MPHVLMVEDDPAIVRNLGMLLRREGFQVTAKGTMADALSALNEPYDLMLLDLSLPDGSGYPVCAAAKRLMPVIFLTASDDEASAVAGLDMGAEDFIAKPFRPMELISRIRTVLRRAGKSAPMVIEDVAIDPARGAVTKGGMDVNLSALEYRLLITLFHNRGAVMTREALLGAIWDAAGDFVNDNTLTVYIKRLREKIETDPQNPTVVRTVRGLGYRAGE